MTHQYRTERDYERLVNLESNKNMEEKSVSPVPALLGFIIIAILITFLADWQNRDADTKYKQDLVDDYDAFYNNCKDYFSENNIIDTVKAYELHKKEIAEYVAFQKEIGYFNEKETNEERVLSAVCKSLNGFSKDESKQVIYDLDNPTKEDPPMKDCDFRGCIYY